MAKSKAKKSKEIKVNIFDEARKIRRRNPGPDSDLVAVGFCESVCYRRGGDPDDPIWQHDFGDFGGRAERTAERPMLLVDPRTGCAKLERGKFSRYYVDPNPKRGIVG